MNNPNQQTPKLYQPAPLHAYLDYMSRQYGSPPLSAKGPPTKHNNHNYPLLQIKNPYLGSTGSEAS
jgi:hypothetical protein